MSLFIQILPRHTNRLHGLRLAVAAVLLCGMQCMLFQVALAQQQSPETIYNIDWNDQLSPSAELKAHDENLLGDSIDLNTGGLTFEHVDVSIPGNSDLPVEIRRRRNSGQPYNNEFADWQLLVPTISTKINSNEFHQGIRWGKNRCTQPLENSIPDSFFARDYFHLQGDAGVLEPYEYSSGVLLNVPGRTFSHVLDKTGSANWPSNAKKVTVDNWYLTCIANIDGAGTEGFYAYAPNGERYRFDVIRSRDKVATNEMWHIKYGNVGPIVSYGIESAYFDVLAASEVVDVNGNWVRYNYNSAGKLTSITSNDGRRINLNYAGAWVSSVVAHPGTADERRWSYSYDTIISVYQYRSPIQANGVPTYGNTTMDANIPYRALETVTLPNGRQWQFDLGGLFARAVPGKQYRPLPYDPNDDPVICKQADQVVSVTHPDGIRGTFELEEITRLNPTGITGQYGPPCPKATLERAAPVYADFMAVVKKTLSSYSVPTSIWQYDYNISGTNNTTIALPDDSKRIQYYRAPEDHSSIMKEEVYANTASTTPMQTTEYTYRLGAVGGSTFISTTVTDDTFLQLRPKEVTITRGSDWYKTRHSYNDGEYSYGYPTKIEKWSSLGSGTRITNYTWLKDQDDWVLGLLNTVTKNGKLFDDYDYDSKGRLVTHKRFGVTVATLDYYTSGDQAGQLQWYQDALQRETTYSNYYRGSPRDITRADNTILSWEIDRNGWVTSHTNARGYQTGYQYDGVGRLTFIDRPEDWSDTDIDYVSISGYLAQRSQKGVKEQVITSYDAMLRPKQVIRDALVRTGPSFYDIYTETSYDAMGRTNFVSLPAQAPGSTIGTETTYDALGRVKRTRETAQDGGTTYYDYLSGNRTKVTDPEGNVTITTASGYGSPDDGQTIKIEKPEGITVDYSYDIYGNLLSIDQAKGDGTSHVSNFVYNDRHLLCRRSVPETGDTLYSYNNANEMNTYWEGKPSGTVCAYASATEGVRLTYDALGRLKTTDYPGNTPDIVRDYDPNGNLTSVNRNGVNWTYSYNSQDLIENETLTLTTYNRSYSIDYGYDNDGLVISKTYPSGTEYLYANDNFGRPLRIRDASGGGNIIDVYTYHPNGKVSYLLRGNGQIYQQSFNQRQLPSYIGNIKYGGGTNWADKRYYDYDANGRVVQIDSIMYDEYDRSFAYDGAGRLISATGPWGTGSYSYDPLGNLTQKSLGSRVVDIEYSDLNQVSRVRDSAVSSYWRSYVYDARGNVKYGQALYGYDYSNQLTAMGGSLVINYVYDGNLKRVRQQVMYGMGDIIYSIYDRSGTLVARDNATTGEITDYLYIAGKNFARITNGETYYPHPDHLGTAILELDSSGDVPASRVYNYTPFGENIAPPFGNPDNDPGDNNEIGYTGHIEDETGLVYMQARYYDPIIGRFHSPDPIGYQDQLNVYAYVGNDPVNNLDPTGEDTVRQEMLIWKAILTSLGPSSPRSGTKSSEAVVNIGIAQASVGHASDSKGGNAIQITVGAGVGNPGLSVGIQDTTTTANTVGDLQGLALEAGGSVGEFVQADLAGIKGNSYTGTSAGVSAASDSSPVGAYKHATLTGNLVEYESTGETLESITNELVKEVEKGPY